MPDWTVKTDENDVILGYRRGVAEDLQTNEQVVTVPYELHPENLFSKDARRIPLTKLVGGSIMLRTQEELDADPRKAVNVLIQKVQSKGYEEIVLRISQAIRDLGDEMEAQGWDLSDRTAYTQLKNFLDLLES